MLFNQIIIHICFTSFKSQISDGDFSLVSMALGPFSLLLMFQDVFEEEAELNVVNWE